MNRMLGISKSAGLIQINDTIIYSLIRLTYAGSWKYLNIYYFIEKIVLL